MESSVRWITVAGTGDLDGTPLADCRAAAAVGRELARHRYGLITGGWHGVDYLVTDAFIRTLVAEGVNPDAYLIQVLKENQPLLHSAGKIIRTQPGALEWLEAQKWSDALILIGGKGGTYYSWLGALHDGLPRFPLGGTSGDAASAFKQTLDLWELMPVPGITVDQFRALGTPIDSDEVADQVAAHLVGELIWRSLHAVDARYTATTQAAPLFISYSHADSEWMARIRTLLRPQERRGLISIWVDSDIEPGLAWESQLTHHLQSARGALILVSKAFLKSAYITDIELPAFARKMSEQRPGEPPFHLFWVLLEDCDWRSVELLKNIQATGGTSIAVASLADRSDQHCKLIEIVETVVARQCS